MLKIFPASKFQNANILIVDDVPFNLKVITAKLTASGYTQLHTAVDGQDALEATRRQQPDLVILDLMMPVMDGFEYIKQVRADAAIEHMPIIVQTALNDRETKLRALSCGADDFVNKPLDLEEVALRVHIHLERFFILQHVEEMRANLKQELQQANETIAKLESKLPESDRELLAKHYDTLKTLAGPIGSRH